MKSLFATILLLLFERAAYCKDSIMIMMESPSANQLENYAKTHPNETTEFGRTVSGIVYPTLTASLTVGPGGLVLLQDRFLIEKLQLFNRERIPERVGHAKGSGAFGFFEVLHDISKYTQADFLQPGKKTKVAARFSSDSGELGSADTLLDLRGFAVKFYTEDGIYDSIGLNVPVFHTRDPMFFPDIARSRKRNPQTNLPDPNAVMDIMSERSETAFFFMWFFSDISHPKSFRCSRGYPIHVHKMVNSKDEIVYVRFQWTPHEKEEFYTFDEAHQMTGNNSNFYIQDLFDNIAKKNYPKWTLSIQVMTTEQAAKHYEDPFDPTKLWRKSEFPLIDIGVMTLNENAQNYFAQIEQLAFNPANMVRGIEPGLDAILQARMFAYNDAQLYRLGVNYHQIPVNSCPFAPKTYHRDGKMNVGTNGGSAPNYYPNTFNGLNSNDNKSYKPTVYSVGGDVDRVDVRVDDDFSQANDHWANNFPADHKKRIIKNLADTLKLTNQRIQKKVLDNIVYKIHKEFGDGVRAALNL